MELVFLGTGAGMPSTRRNVSSVALRFDEMRNAFWLFDCGEATQHQIMKTNLKLSKLDKVFITHLHGDHLFGLPGLLTSRANQGVTEPLELFGPKGLSEYVETALRISGSRLQYPLKIRELDRDYMPGRGEPLCEDEHARVYCGRLDHRIECFGYRIEEKDRPGKLNDRKLAELGIRPGPIYGRLKNGEKVTLEDGTVLDGSDFVGPPIAGRIAAVMGDTRKTKKAVALSRDATVLVHEATFAADLHRLARQYYHATARDAAETAAAAGAKSLILTHISARYQGEEEKMLLAEARGIFPKTMLAADFSTFQLSHR